MSQHDFVIPSQTAQTSRLNIESALQAAATNSSGPTEPGTTYANQFWYDTNNNYLKIRNEGDTDWITIGELDQTNDRFNPIIGSWKLLLSSTSLVFEYNGTNKGKIDASGNLTVVVNVTANGTV